MGCYLKRPQLLFSAAGLLLKQWFQWAATSNALSYGTRTRRAQDKRKKFQWAATSNALSYTGTAKPSCLTRSFNGLLPQTPSATPNRKFCNSRTSKSFNGLLPQTPSATCLEVVYESTIYVSMGCYLKRPQLLGIRVWLQPGTSMFQWAATSNALSYWMSSCRIV